MKELSLNVLDIAENAVKAGAKLISIVLSENEETLTVTVTDDGCGMREETLRSVIDPFYTTRTTRKVGLGIPLIKLAAEQTGGYVTITSRHESEYPNSHGTCVTALFFKQHIDFTPMGDIISTLTTLIQGSPQIDFDFQHETADYTVRIDTREMREILGTDISLNDPEILRWIGQYLEEQYKNNIQKERN